jgi:hypothetical protein
MTVASVVLAQQQSSGEGVLSTIVSLVMFVIFLAAGWKLFTKAGRSGWEAIIPIYNTLIMLKIVGRPWWWLLLLLVPFLNIIIGIIVANDLSKSFGHGVGYTIGLVLLPPIFLLLLAFCDSQYHGPAAA